MKPIVYREIEGRSAGYLALLGVLGVLIALGLGSAYYMEHHGHIVTGMTNQIVWGMPHVFAVFLIVAASGALNVASIGSVFGKTMYKPMGPLSALLALALLAGGLTILLLDLGRPDRLIVAATTYNFKSIFAWNVILYSGFFGIVGVYLWMQMDKLMYKFAKPAGFAAFIWRLILTTGTGSIFGFLVARAFYDSAMLAPMFVVMSFSYGLAIFILVLMASYSWSGRPLGDAVVNRLKNLQGVFIAGALYFVVVFHLTNLYFTKHHGVEHFILVGGGGITTMFWLGQIILGSLVPLAMVYHPKLGKNRTAIAVACVLVVLGGLAQMYVTIIGGQSYPLVLFPGYQESSSFFDGVVHPYSPSLPEILLGIGGFAVAMIMVAIGVKVLRFLPESLDNHAVDPHAK
ncbi:MAG: NrfD/PsrC family molybdoenzyme membrane anchor subunit [Sulfuricellaceae bacterium]|jgi:Ni/Fe-hydrogenase subunit HybB-like protein